jgi:hypothetical protein
MADTDTNTPETKEETSTKLPTSTEEIENQIDEGLADKFPAEPETKTEDIEPDVFDEEKKEELKRPEGLEDKFWDEKKGVKTEELSKSYKELRDHVSKGHHKAPKNDKGEVEYNNEVFKNVDKKDKTVNIFQEWAKDSGVSQAKYDDLVKKIIDQSNVTQEEEKIDIDREKQKLGPNAEERIKANSQWFEGYKRKQIFTEAEEDIFKIAAADAVGQRWVEKIRNMIGEQVPQKLEPTGEELQSIQDIKAQIGSKKYNQDPVYRSKVYNQLKRATGKDPENPLD